MTTEHKEVVTYFGRCRCCLAYSYLKNMWIEHSHNGNSEVYTEMLEQCYGFSLDPTETPELDQICEICIRKLREALEFKNLILESNNTLLDQITDDKTKIELEDDDDDMGKCDVQVVYTDDSESNILKKENEDTLSSQNMEETTIEELCGDDNEFDDGNVIIAHGKGTDEVYENVEYLDDDADNKQIANLDETEEKGEIKRKWPKKLPRLFRNRRYKQYTEDELRQCVESVKNETMSAAEAAKYYNIPKKTIDKKLRLGDDDVADEKKAQIYQFHKEIKSILSFTNATPFKSNVVKYYCIYCLEAVFTDGEELRNHTRTHHIDERTKKVDIFMRPHWENEILKLDIENLLCVVCCQAIPEWNDMLQHIETVHKVNLDRAYSQVVPYILNEDLKCALCKASFSNHLQIDGHMNSHYENYVCSECGDPLLTQSRLKAHMKTHEVGQFPCEICDKVFTQDTYRRKHVRLVHIRNLRFKCMHCEESFPSEVSRKNHMQANHMDKIKPIQCDECNKIFYWRQYYTAHKRKTHGDKTYNCILCEKSFTRNYQLQEHLMSHSKVKSVECPECHKKYMTKTSMRIHLMKQHKKKKQTFNQIVESTS